MITNFKFKTATLTACSLKDIYSDVYLLKNKDIIYNLLEDKNISNADIKFLQGVYGDKLVRSFPIKDFGVPESMAAYNVIIEDIMVALKTGHNVLVHCFGGIGRTGLIIVGIFTRLMGSAEDAYAFVASKRKAIETPEQSAFLLSYERWLKENKILKENT